MEEESNTKHTSIVNYQLTNTNFFLQRITTGYFFKENSVMLLLHNCILTRVHIHETGLKFFKIKEQSLEKQQSALFHMMSDLLMTMNDVF